jgi:N-succinyldiaminopimelate aminotransferase
VNRGLDIATALGLMTPDGVRPTIFAEMTALATRTGAVNLGQGFPDDDGPRSVIEAAVAALRAGRNQYAPGDGVPELRHAVATHQRAHYGLDWDPDSQVLVTTGATEALAAAVLALAGPGDDVVVIEPYYDAYAAVVALAGARLVTVGLLPDGEDGGFRLDRGALAAAIGPRTAIVIVNTPHNPTGTVLGVDDLTEIGRLATAAGAVVVTDEVYEHLTYDGVRHVPMATLPGMAERTLTVSSAGKSLSFTGWKVGWVTGPADLVSAVRTVKQFLTYTSGAPLQPAVAAGLDDPAVATWVRELATSLGERRDLLCEGLTAAGFRVVVPKGAYFVLADGSAFDDDGARLCRNLPDLAGVVGIPVTAFCVPGGAVADRLRPWVRFTFVKRRDVLADGVARLARLRPSS